MTHVVAVNQKTVATMGGGSHRSQSHNMGSMRLGIVSSPDGVLPSWNRSHVPLVFSPRIVAASSRTRVPVRNNSALKGKLPSALAVRPHENVLLLIPRHVNLVSLTQSLLLRHPRFQQSHPLPQRAIRLILPHRRTNQLLQRAKPHLQNLKPGL